MPPRCTSIAILTTYLLTLCACDAGASDSSNPLSRSGMFSPMRYDEDPIRVKLRDVYTVIPANCFDSPLEPEATEDHGYVVDSDVLLSMLVPGLACRTPANREMFSITGPRRPGISVLVQSLGPEAEPRPVFRKLLENRLSEFPQVGRTRSRLAYQTGVERVYTSNIELPSRSASRAVYVSRNSPEFTECVRDHESLSANSRPLIPNCTLTFFVRNKLVEVNIGGAFEAQRLQIRDAVRRKLEGFVQPPPEEGGTH
jgi:hypothetical protein